jgi:streptogramin lyase
VSLVRRLLLLAVVSSVVLPGAATAAPAVNGEFPVSDTPKYLTQGPDGNIWATIGMKIARVTPSGTVTEFDPPNVGTPVGITTGPDGNLWVTQSNEVAKFSPTNPNGAQNFAITGLTDPRGITTGPDGNLWTGSGGNLFKIPPAAPTTFTPFPVLMGARGIARGGDGRIWVADFLGQRIARVTTAGSATYFAVGGGPQEVAAGPGTQVAFTNPGASPQQVGRIVPGGIPQTTNVPMTDPFGVTLGPDGAYWIAQFATSKVARLTSAGQVTTLSGLSAGSGPRYIAAGPGNTLWVSLETAKKIARITGVTAPPASKPPAGGGATVDTTAPRIAALKLSRRTFRLGRRLPALLSAVRTGTVVGFTLPEAARVTFRFQRRTVGRRVGKRCRKKTRANARKKKCVRYVRVRGSFTVDGRSGKNRVRFQGRISRKRKLRPGRYRMVLRARDAAGNRSTTARARFRLLRAKKKK